MDAQTSHTDSSCIRGWLAIQAMGRTERIDKEELKKKSYALSPAHRTSLPKAHRDALLEANIDRPPLQPPEVPTNEEPEDEADVEALRQWLQWRSVPASTNIPPNSIEPRCSSTQLSGCQKEISHYRPARESFSVS